MKTVQALWAYHKYWVMGHSQAHYNAIRLLFKGNDWSAEKEVDFHQLLTEAQALAPTGATRRVAYQHIWGYFKKKATAEEAATYKQLVADEASYDELEAFLLDLIDRYQPAYLVRSKFYQERGL